MKTLITTLTILLLLNTNNIFAQNTVHPDRNKKKYHCGQVQENILKNLDNANYQMPTKFKIKLKANFSKKRDIEKAKKVVELCNKVLNDVDFWNALENYKSYRHTVWKCSNKQQVVSGKQIVNCLINAYPNDYARPQEMLVEINLDLYGLGFKFPFIEKALAKEVGDGKIYNKKWFFREYPIEEIGSNWIHEFSHIQGIYHRYDCSEERDYSIPYVINRIFVEVAKKYL